MFPITIYQGKEDVEILKELCQNIKIEIMEFEKTGWMGFTFKFILCGDLKIIWLLFGINFVSNQLDDSPGKKFDLYLKS